jgi:hypothetical protein
MRMKDFDINNTAVLSNIYSISRCQTYAKEKAPLANRKFCRNGRERTLAEIYNYQLSGKYSECCAQQQLLTKLGIRTLVDFIIYSDNKDRGDLHDQNNLLYEVKGSTIKAHNYLLTCDKYGKDTLPSVDYHVAVRWVEINGIIRFDAGIIDRSTFNREHEMLRAGEKITGTNMSLESDNWCVRLKYFDYLM